MLSREQLLKFVSAGITASSPDNSQPWKFTLLDDEIMLSLDPRFLGMFFDGGNFASLLGCGGVIENIRLVALEAGLQTVVTRLEPREPDFKVASLKFSSSSIKTDSLVDAIYKRCTHRGFYYRDIEVPTNYIEDIQRSVTDISGAHIHWYRGDAKKRVTSILRNTDRLRYTHKALHHDFYAKLRFGDEIYKQADGLAANTLGLSSLFTFSLPFLKSWRVASLLNKLGMHYFMAFRGAHIPLCNAPLIGSLVLPTDTDTLEQGRAIQRLWLSVNRYDGLHFQPFGAFPLFIYRMKSLFGEGFDEKQQRFLSKYINELEQLTGMDPEKERTVLLFRIGFANSPDAYSLRRPLDSFLLN